MWQNHGHDMLPSGTNRARVILAFLASPTIIPFVFCVSIVDGPGHESVWDIFTCLALFTVYGLPTAYLVELLLGLPAWLLFRHFKVRSVLAFAGAGAVIGWLFLSFDAIGFVGAPRNLALLNPLSDSFSITLIVAACASAILFRAIAYSAAFTLTSVRGTVGH
jgi:hypothetical protein